jgi:membrane protease YdiL (CAAX protease family)
MTDQPPRTDETAAVVLARPVEYRGAGPLRSDLEMPYVRRRDALLDLILVLLAAIVVPYLPAVVAPPGPNESNVPDIGAMAIVQKWCEAGLATGLLLYFVLRQRIRPSTFGLRRDEIGRQALWGIAALASVYVALIASSVIVLTLFLTFPELKSELAKREEFVDAMPVHHLATTLILLVAVAVHEEALFRGLLLPFLRRLLGNWWWAGLVSALIFAGLHVPHQGLLGGAQIFSIAIVLTVFFVLSRSLLAVTLAHLLFDFIQFQIYRIVPDLHKWLESFEA